MRTDKTSNSTRPEDNHSPECDSASAPPKWSPPKQRIKFPSSKEKEKWQELDNALGQGLRKMVKKDSSITSVTEFIYQTSLVKFDPRQIKLPSEPKPSRRQRELAILRKEKIVLRRR